MRDFLDFDILVDCPKSGVVSILVKHRERDISVDRLLKNPSGKEIGGICKQMLQQYADLYRECTMKFLTPKQKRFYDELVKFYISEGRAPTYSEMSEMFGKKRINKGTAHYHIRKLREAGWVWIDEDGHAIPKDIASE